MNEKRLEEELGKLAAKSSVDLPSALDNQTRLLIRERASRSKGRGFNMLKLKALGVLPAVALLMVIVFISTMSLLHNVGPGNGGKIKAKLSLNSSSLYSGEQLTLTVHNDGKNDLYFETPYRIEKFVGNSWQLVPEPNNWVWTSGLCVTEPGESFSEQAELTPGTLGRYRISKVVRKGPRIDAEKATVSAEFTIMQNDAYPQIALGKYVSEDGLAWVMLKEYNEIEFLRHLATSYMPRGKYSIQGDELTLRVTDSEQYTFIIKGNTIIFQSGEFAESLVEKGTVFTLSGEE